MSCIQKITLTNFRNHKSLVLTSSQNTPNLILGRNGAGKTNILEALSLLSPGKGIKGSSFKNMGYNGNDWKIEVTLINKDMTNTVTMFTKNQKRNLYLDSTKQENFSNLTKLMNLVWITPQMNHIFISESEKKRKLFDRIVFNSYGSHLESIMRYNYAKTQRMNLLLQNINDTKWLSSIERVMAESSIHISDNRNNVIQALNLISHQDCLPDFCINLTNDIGGRQNTNLKEHLIKMFYNNRGKDTRSKKTNYGPHVTNFVVVDRMKNIEAEKCSTGEQKLLLISIILGTLKNNTLLLLDDIISHLDAANRSRLLEYLSNTIKNVWITDTNHELYNSYKAKLFIHNLDAS